MRAARKLEADCEGCGGLRQCTRFEAHFVEPLQGFLRASRDSRILGFRAEASRSMVQGLGNSRWRARMWGVGPEP